MTNNLYLEADVRGLEHEIIHFIKELLNSYNLTIHDVIREVSTYFAIAVTKTLIDFVKEQYNKYKN